MRRANPLGGLFSGLLSSLKNAAAIQRVEDCTNRNCPESGGMFAAAPAASASSAGSSGGTTSSAPPASSAAAGVLTPAGYWEQFGPFLRETGYSEGPPVAPDEFASQGPTTVYLPGTGELALDAAALLPGEEIAHEEYTYGYHDGEPFIAAALTIREAASGLQPEQYVDTVLAIEPSRELRVLGRTEVRRGEEQVFRIVGSSSSGVVAVQHNPSVFGIVHDAPEAAGVDAIRGEVVWRQSGWELDERGGFDTTSAP